LAALLDLRFYLMAIALVVASEVGSAVKGGDPLALDCMARPILRIQWSALPL
jgi:hypothetical protein